MSETSAKKSKTETWENRWDVWYKELLTVIKEKGDGWDGWLVADTKTHLDYG